MRKLVLYAVIFFSLLACDRMLLRDESYVTADDYLKPPPDLNDGIQVSTMGDVQIDSVKIYSMVKNLQSNEYNRIRSILIARNNKLVMEAYFNGWNRTRKQDLRSATKSFTSALMGIALDKGIVNSVDEKVISFFPEYESIGNWDARKDEMTIRDFLRMRTGLQCNDWSGHSPGNEEKMYETHDWVKFILDLPVLKSEEPIYSYCTGAPVTLGAIISNASGKTIPEFAHENLFSPLGIEEYAWEYMPNGRADTGGHLHLRPRDMLKFGLLYLNNGEWNGRSLISSEWVAESTQPNGSVPGAGSTQYAYLWWCNSWDVEGKIINTYFANGNGGQMIFVLKEVDMVIVFTGGAYNTDFMSSILSIIEKNILSAVEM